MLRLKPTLLVAAVATLSAVSSAQAPVFFDGFLFDNLSQPRENVRGQLQGDLTGFFLWDVTNGSVDLEGPGATQDPSILLGRYVNLGGSTGDPGQFETNQAIALAPGVQYTLSFDYFSPTGGAASANVTFLEQTFAVNSASSTEFQTFRQTFTSSTLVNTSRITFQDLGNGVNGLGIDNVSLLPVSAVPEPATIAALGLGGLALLRRRRARS